MSSKTAASRMLAAFVAASLTILNAQSLDRSRDGRRFYADDPLWRDNDMRDIQQPAEHDLSKSHEFVSNTFGDPSRSEGPALNVNTLGEVPDSSWFTNRLGRHDMTVEEVLRGPNQVDGPADGPWQVTGRPESGITPKFTIRDARGDTYMIKLDPASNPELPSSVELISTKIFHAIGYHVPEDFIVHFDIDRLSIAPGAKIRTATGSRVLIEMRDVERWLKRVPRRSDGSIRALASRYVPGKVVGQYTYSGQRPDDPNDLYPHERRRELRGLRLFAAWLNHDDARAINSIDTYVEDHGRHYVRHYLQDFGSNLGSGSTSAQQPRGGYEYLIDGSKIMKGLAGLGLYQRDWMTVRWPKLPSVGNIEADVFEPVKWKTEYPNPAFLQMDAADAFWAASIASRFTNQMVRGMVEDSFLSDHDAALYLSDVIIRRRDKVVAWGITGTNPIDRFEIRNDGAAELIFDNAALRLGIVDSKTQHRVLWAALDNRNGTTQEVGVPITSDERHFAVPGDAWGPRDDTGARYAVASIATLHDLFPHWARSIDVTIRDRRGALDIVGIARPEAWCAGCAEGTSPR